MTAAEKYGKSYFMPPVVTYDCLLYTSILGNRKIKIHMLRKTHLGEAEGNPFLYHVLHRRLGITGKRRM